MEIIKGKSRNEYMKDWFISLSDAKKAQRNLDRTKRRQDKKSKYVKKFGSICYDCKQSFIDCVFEFHHLDPETKIHTDPSKVFMFSDKRIEEELSKCVMLCANCHRVRHHNDRYKAHEKRNNSILKE